MLYGYCRFILQSFCVCINISYLPLGASLFILENKTPAASAKLCPLFVNIDILFAQLFGSCDTLIKPSSFVLNTLVYSLLSYLK